MPAQLSKLHRFVVGKPFEIQCQDRQLIVSVWRRVFAEVRFLRSVVQNWSLFAPKPSLKFIFRELRAEIGS